MNFKNIPFAGIFLLAKMSIFYKNRAILEKHMAVFLPKYILIQVKCMWGKNLLPLSGRVGGSIFGKSQNEYQIRPQKKKNPPHTRRGCTPPQRFGQGDCGGYFLDSVNRGNPPRTNFLSTRDPPPPTGQIFLSTGGGSLPDKKFSPHGTNFFNGCLKMAFMRV